MTFAQSATLVLLLALLVAFAVDRFRIEIVAIAGLAAGILLGIVPFGKAFSGFANPAVITVAEILMLVGLISRSFLMDRVARWLAPFATSELSTIALVCGLGAVTSAFMNNIGALALWVPVALSLCRSSGVAPGNVLIPLSFATLLGGTCSLIGTPANLVVSGFQMEAIGQPFAFFELAWVGVPITAIGLVWLVSAAPQLLAGRGLRKPSQDLEQSRQFFTELQVVDGSPLLDLSIAEAERQLRGTIYSHLRDGHHLFGSRKHHLIRAGDVLLIEADAQAISEASHLRKADLSLPDGPEPGDAWVEAIVLPHSTIVGSTAHTMEAFSSKGIRIVAMATRLQRIEGRLADLQARVGDILLLRGDPEAIAQALDETDCLQLTPRTNLTGSNQGWRSLIAFAGAIALAGTNLVPPELAFGAALLFLALGGDLDLRAAVSELNWPILIMLAAMIPIGDAVASTGLADVVAQRAVASIGSTDSIALIATVLVTALAITPFVNNVSAAVALAPIAVAIAQTSGVSPEPLLVAVAIGVSLDFLTPFGHHNNTLVMSIGNYRFGDFPRVGLLLTICTVIPAIVLIQFAFG
ncbi:hypothetical protein AUC68_10080 [Methyloceanibacter methanicus]|uniref:RCK C-terminal domain-containing protein n=1 Tax=Methyloceanibacter methanicus TaxID=1774968 RepID=A0A1E3VWH1_9HYPH|nr:SLC13 family permease [Methyloceanibacter methanicus]ODR97880.1 hypothetical protein AUC68_10080 [Methyloceanibacter methanicus]